MGSFYHFENHLKCRIFSVWRLFRPGMHASLVVNSHHWSAVDNLRPYEHFIALIKWCATSFSHIVYTEVNVKISLLKITHHSEKF